MGSTDLVGHEPPSFQHIWTMKEGSKDGWEGWMEASKEESKVRLALSQTGEGARLFFSLCQ